MTARYQLFTRDYPRELQSPCIFKTGCDSEIQRHHSGLDGSLVLAQRFGCVVWDLRFVCRYCAPFNFCTPNLVPVHDPSFWQARLFSQMCPLSLGQINFALDSAPWTQSNRLKFVRLGANRNLLKSVSTVTV